MGPAGRTGTFLVRRVVRKPEYYGQLVGFPATASGLAAESTERILVSYAHRPVRADKAKDERAAAQPAGGSPYIDPPRLLRPDRTSSDPSGGECLRERSLTQSLG